ncbi:MAG: glycine betaine/L-proline ABC transporter substrate-binding protein ProX [bacterium]|nr:glycine betaine/L-proline ABC transporter substrate-binding protein ProX [bacterium]
MDDAVTTSTRADPAAAGEEPDVAKPTEEPEVAKPAEEDGRDGDSASQVSLPGEGVNVTMARAPWNTGYFQAEVYKALLEELGYTVSDPSQAEMPPGNFYVELARGDFDLWVNSWFPAHDQFLAVELPDGSLVSDHVSVIGEQMLAGGLNGFVIDKNTADVHGIVTMADIADNPEIAALFDSDGNGKADLLGCNERWGCREIIDQTIARNGWEDTIEQISGEYYGLFWVAWERHLGGEPLFTYAWSPSLFAGVLRPGVSVYWLTVPNPLPDQRGAAVLPPEQCPGQPCELGFVPADILVTANNGFLEANRPAAILLERVVIPSTDVNRQIVRMETGEGSQADITRHAHEWIESNRDTVDRWVAAAMTAAETTTTTVPDTTTTTSAATTTTAPDTTTTTSAATTTTAPDTTTTTSAATTTTTTSAATTTTTTRVPTTTVAPGRPGKFSDFNGADAATWQQMHADGEVVACYEGIALPLDSFCLDENFRFSADYSQVLDVSFMVIHLPDGDGVVLQGSATFRAGGSVQLGWITFEKVGANRVITHLEP